MNRNTKYFGEMQIDEAEVLFFPEAIPGFEEEHKYALIPFFEGDDSMVCLQSVENSELAFVLLNPFCIEEAYQPRLTNEDLNILKSDKDTPLAFYVPAVVKEDFRRTTVNLKCPIAVNPATHLAKQIIMEDDRYSMRTPMTSLSSETGNRKEGEE